jgi:hypothetical protein
MFSGTDDSLSHQTQAYCNGEAKHGAVIGDIKVHHHTE